LPPCMAFAPAAPDQSMVSALPVGDLSVGTRNDNHEPSRAKEQRPERIPIDPEHRSYSRNVTTGGWVIDLPRQNGRRLEHDYEMRRDPRLGAGLGIAADTRSFFRVACHNSVSLQLPNPRSGGNARRVTGMRPSFTPPSIKTLSFASGTCSDRRGRR
jgi:hypothetical protein